MNIDWTYFTPWASLAGGVLLGVASALFILLNGRILGISGILGGLLPAKSGDASWRITFMLGLIASPLLMKAFAPAQLLYASRIEANMVMVVIAGLLVGLGTRYGSGCTSGHGVCGLSRLSPRSMAATGLFMAAGFATVYVFKHLL
jgi:uncharacterized membrane protein YedE/YeeE